MTENIPLTVGRFRKFLDGFYDNAIIDVGIRVNSENHVCDVKDIRVSNSENRITLFGDT